MKENFEQVKAFALELGLEIVSEEASEELIVVNDEDRGIYNLIIDCEFPILIFEMLIYPLKNKEASHLLRLLQMNRDLIHGAFAVDEDGVNMIFRDTLQLENLDFNEFEGTINALTMGLGEFSGELLGLNKEA